MTGLRIKVLWPDTPGCGCGCDCCDIPEEQVLMVLHGHGVDYWTTRRTPGLMLRADILSEADRKSAEVVTPEVPPSLGRFGTGTPPDEPARGRFQRAWVETLYAAGFTFRPTSPREDSMVMHAVCSGDEVVGWVMPGRPERIADDDSGEWVKVPT